MTQEDRIIDAYPLSALFINACNMDVSHDLMLKLFQALGIPCQKKLAEMFEMSPNKINELVSTVSAAPVPVASQPAEEALKEKPAKEEKKEEPEEDEDIDFGDMFG